MKKSIPLTGLIAITAFCCVTFGACTPTYQYDVIVENQTEAPLQITYKTETDKRGLVQEVVLLKANERKRIISTKNINTSDGKLGSSAEHCNLVAEHLVAKKLDGSESKKKWCSEDVKFEKVDIQQAEFTMVFGPTDF